MKARTQLTLTDLSSAMLDVSRRINPACEHIAGDMRSLRLGRRFDAVFVHDAICYMTSEADLKRAIETAFVHRPPGGVALFVPDELRETFAAPVEHGGHDASADGPDAGQALRYLEWSWDPDPADCRTASDFAYLLREADGSVRAISDRLDYGLFARATRLGLLREAGFLAEPVASGIGSAPFLAIRPS